MMHDVRVIAAQGATLRGPIRLRLDRDQHAPRTHVLGPANRRGLYALDGGKAVQFKFGEVIGIEADGLTRLSADLFAPVQAVPETAE